MQGILMQGTRNGESCITAFTLSYGVSEDDLIPYESYPSQTQVILWCLKYIKKQ